MRRSSNHLASRPFFHLIVFLLGIGALSACGTHNGAGYAPPTPTTNTPRKFIVVAQDTSFDMPATIPAGLLSVALENQGSALHQVQFAQLHNGETADQVVAAIKQQGAVAATKLTTLAGGVTAVEPRNTQRAVLSLTPGSYLALSLLPNQHGSTQVSDGLYKAFTVSGGGPALPPPQANGEATLQNFTITLPTAIDTSGTMTIKVTNQGPQPYALSLVKLVPGKTLQDVMTFLQGTRAGPAPFTGAGGIAGLAPGASGWAVLDLLPGQYLALSLLPDPATGQPDAAMGMVKPFNVNE